MRSVAGVERVPSRAWPRTWSGALAGSLPALGGGAGGSVNGGLRSEQVTLAQMLADLVGPGAKEVAQQAVIQPILDLFRNRFLRIAFDGIGRGFLHQTGPQARSNSLLYSWQP